MEIEAGQELDSRLQTKSTGSRKVWFQLKKRNSLFCLNSKVLLCSTLLRSPSADRHLKVWTVGENAWKCSALERHFLWKDFSAQDVQSQWHVEMQSHCSHFAPSTVPTATMWATVLKKVDNCKSGHEQQYQEHNNQRVGLGWNSITLKTANLLVIQQHAGTPQLQSLRLFPQHKAFSHI